MQVDHNKYFSNALKTIIAPSLKKHGFTKRGTLTFIRRTEFDIIQTINFQKSKWGNQGFYVNSCSLSLHNKREHFIGDIGHRIQSFNGSINASFNFQIPIIGDICLKEIKETILNRILPYLDFTKSLEDIHQLAIFSTENLENYPFLKSFVYKYPNEGSEIAFRYLCLQDYDRALDIYDRIEEREFNPETKEWTYFKSKRYDDIISQLVNKEYEEIEKNIANNIQISLVKTKFEKLKPVSVQSIPLEELISTLKPSDKPKASRSQYPAYHYKIFGKQPVEVVFKNVKEELQNKYKLIVRDLELIIQISEEHSFYLAINNSDYVQNENSQIISEYKGTKEVEWISSEISRIEFWSDEDKNMDYFNEHLFLIESIEKMDIEILHGELYGDIITFFKEN